MGRDEDATPLRLTCDPSAVHARKPRLVPGQDVRIEHRRADENVAIQGYGGPLQPQPAAADQARRLPAGVDQGGDDRQGAVFFKDLEPFRVAEIRVGEAVVQSQALNRKGCDRNIGTVGLPLGVDLTDQTATVAVIEAVVLIGVLNVIAVEQGLVGRPLGREAEAPGARQIERAMGQQIAAVLLVPKADIAFVIPVAVPVEVAEGALIGVAAAGDDRSVDEATAPLKVQQRRDPRVELWADQPVLGWRDDVQIGGFDRDATAFVIVDERHQEAGRPFDGGIRVGEKGGVEDGHPADAEHRIAVDDGAQGLILNHLLGLDREAGGLGALVVADGAGGEDGVVQLIDPFAAADRRRGHQAGAVAETGGEIDGHRRLQLAVGLQMAGVDDRAVRRDGLDAAVGRGRAGGQIIGQVLAPKHMTVSAQIDPARAVALGDDRVADTAGAVGVHIDGALGQDVGNRRLSRHWLSLGDRLVREGQTRQERRAGQKPGP